ncbi:MAG: PocR ligand-binding domain-containing protein [Oscillospiraceae bacterium]|nr:PocR ligand-binding domain-containing protein [Oscillospiraceae bacterium]MDY4587595.1 PocR ligand-binding domain-containing protein [Oscillospiraceae bacterium]
MDLNNITLLDVIDRKTLQGLQDAFAAATGMAALATDDTGPVTDGSNFTDFCMNLTRKSKIGCDRCNQCDLKGGAEASRTGKPAVYYCHGGLMDFAAPVMLNGKLIGSLIGGQVLPEEPDEEKFRRIAVEIGVDPDQYIAALRKVKIVPKQQIEAAANLLYQMANALSEVGYQRLIALENQHRNDAVTKDLTEKFATINESMNNVTSNILSLENVFATIKESAAASSKAVESTDGIVKAIENASTQLTLIGFNASIEAKRAGAAGAGFNVIAQEVRTLADKNTKQANEVENTLNEIKKAIVGINAQLKTCNAEIQKNAEVIEKLRNLVDEANAQIQELK